MTNNLKIIIILFIFVSILTGYFYFSLPSFVKKEENNQLISNNNNEEDKKVTDIDNKDNNKEEKEEVSSKPSRINLRLIIFIIIIIIIIIGFIIFIIIKLIIKNKKNKKNKKKFKFNEESRKDFAKENFCPVFFIISDYKVNKFKKKHKEFNNVKQNEKFFFNILAKLIFSDFKKEEEKIKKIKISLNRDDFCDKIIDDNTLIITLNSIKICISQFALGHTKHKKFKEEAARIIATDIIFGNRNNNKKIETLLKEAEFFAKCGKETQKIKDKYSNYIEFCSYLYSYLIYYLLETFTSKHNDKEITITTVNENNVENFGFIIDPINFCGDYTQVNPKIMEQILNEKLLPRLNNQKPIEQF